MKIQGSVMMVAALLAIAGVPAKAGEATTNKEAAVATLSRSQTIESVWYDAASKALVVCFYRSGSYRFSGVPESVYKEFVNAPSMGRSFHTLLRGRYPSRRLLASDPGDMGSIAAITKKSQGEE